MNGTRPKPAHEVRFGLVKAAIWRNDTENGARYNTTFSRAYRDGEQWKNTDSFGRDDLLLLGKVANEAHTWIHQQAREAGAETAPAAGGGTPSSGAAQRPAAAPAAGGGFARGRGGREPQEF